MPVRVDAIPVVPLHDDRIWPGGQQREDNWLRDRVPVHRGVSGGPVLRGAILAAVDQARAELLASVAS